MMMMMIIIIFIITITISSDANDTGKSKLQLFYTHYIRLLVQNVK